MNKGNHLVAWQADLAFASVSDTLRLILVVGLLATVFVLPAIFVGTYVQNAALAVLIGFVVEVYALALLSKTQTGVELSKKLRTHKSMDRLITYMGTLLSPVIFASLITLALVPVAILLGTGKDTPNWYATITASFFVLGLYLLDRRAAAREERAASERERREEEYSKRFA